MTKTKKYSLIAAVVILCVIMVFLGGQINATRANLVQGGGADVQLDLTSLDVKLLENGAQVTDENGEGMLLKALQDVTIDPGYTYPEEIAVQNTGSSPEYVRVVITKYWTKDGQKDTAVDPGTIQLLQDSDSWFINEAESTAEQTVYYYRKALQAGETTPLLFHAIRLDNSIAKDFTITPDPNNSKVIRAVFAYDGRNFNVEAEAQSVQYKYANEAIPSAWGVNNLRVVDGEITAAQ